MHISRPTRPWSWLGFTALLLLQVWAAHAIDFFAHEYAHSFTAWLLGWKANPLALNYAHPTPAVLLAQFGIDQNVDETPIFLSGHGRDAALIAAAGMVIGNGLITYTLSRLGSVIAARRNLRGWGMFFYWTTVASIGNFIDYVPLRTFSKSGDMYSLERGLSWSPWVVLLVLGIPTACALLHFIFRVQPATVLWLFPNSAPRRLLLLILTGAALWGFYGADGLLEGGPYAYQMSRLSVFLLLPIVTFGSWIILRRHSLRQSGDFSVPQ